LMHAIKHSSDDRIPEPSRHRVKSVNQELNQMRDVGILPVAQHVFQKTISSETQWCWVHHF